MATQHQIMKRREEIGKCLAKSITTPLAIVKQTNIPLSTVRNDLHWMRKNSRKWLSGHALDGYIFNTKNTIEQLQDIELELQALRSNETDVDRKLKIMHELRETINMRWVIEGDGPTLMAQRFAENHGGKAS